MMDYAALLEVAIPSNQVGNFHPRKDCDGVITVDIVAIPSNQVGNFHPERPPARSAGG